MLLPLIMFFIFGYFLMFGMISATLGNSTTSDTNYSFEFANVSELVLAYEPMVRQFAKEEGIEEYVPILLALMMQESGGQGGDPMQVSEAVCGSIGCIKTPAESIEHGVKNFKKMLDKANGKLLVALQAYNFGSYFIDWINERGGEYTLELAIEFSREMYNKEKARGRGHLYSCAIADAKELGACYGDYLYVQHVMRYVGGNSDVKGSGVWSNPLDFMRMTSGFRTAQRPNHNGVDFSCNKQHIPVYAVDDGIVEESLYGKKGNGFGGYGNIVLIKHNSSLYSLYAHLQDRYVVKGQEVKKGQAIGTCGGSGDSGYNAYTIHLHLEARTTKNGGQINPNTLLDY